MTDGRLDARIASALYAIAGAVLGALVSAFILVSDFLSAGPTSGKQLVPGLILIIAAIFLGSFATGAALAAARSVLPLLAHVGSVTLMMVIVLVIGSGGGALWPLAVAAVGAISAIPSAAGALAGTAVRSLAVAVSSRHRSRERRR